jgi:hypothetical protein
MESFVTSYKGMSVDGKLFEEKEWIFPDNSLESIVQFTREAVSGFIFKKPDGTTGYKGIYSKQKQ